tara:strand:+ start:5 stop:172 length:168 start_codon:yes stop_codon:yes gene_type:complete
LWAECGARSLVRRDLFVYIRKRPSRGQVHGQSGTVPGNLHLIREFPNGATPFSGL